jgi:hypothetical protein
MPKPRLLCFKSMPNNSEGRAEKSSHRTPIMEAVSLKNKHHCRCRKWRVGRQGEKLGVLDYHACSSLSDGHAKPSVGPEHEVRVGFMVHTIIGGRFRLGTTLKQDPLSALCNQSALMAVTAIIIYANRLSRVGRPSSRFGMLGLRQEVVQGFGRSQTKVV